MREQNKFTQSVCSSHSSIDRCMSVRLQFAIQQYKLFYLVHASKLLVRISDMIDFRVLGPISRVSVIVYETPCLLVHGQDGVFNTLNKLLFSCQRRTFSFKEDANTMLTTSKVRTARRDN